MKLIQHYSTPPHQCNLLSSHSLSNMHTQKHTQTYIWIHLLLVRRANLECSCMTSGQGVIGHRENWPLTLLDPIYRYNDHATVSTLCHQSVQQDIKWLRHACRKSIYRLITHHIKNQLWHTVNADTWDACFTYGEKSLCAGQRKN